MRKTILPGLLLATAVFVSILFTACDNKKEVPVVSTNGAVTVPDKMEDVEFVVDYDKTALEVIEAANYSFVCPRAETGDFAKEATTGTHTVKGVLVHFTDKTTMKQALAWSDSTTFRPATIKELAALGYANKTYADDRYIIAIGSKAKVGSSEYSPLLMTSDHSFRTNSWTTEKWNVANGVYYLFVRKE
jgi:hypothetical protein